MAPEKNIQNPGSALGEAIGSLMEESLGKVIKPLVEKRNCLYITSGPLDSKTGRKTKLLLRDATGIDYNSDALIANKKFQPLILIESKYIRYKKHNRDKGSWVCTAHTALRRRFSSIRSSITVLAGNWSKTSKALLRSFDVTLFEIPFEKLCEILADYNIDFEWDEKDRKKAYVAWKKFLTLDEKKRKAIGDRIVKMIVKDLTNTISKVLDDSTPRNITEVEVQVTTSFGEVKIFTFDNLKKAAKFLKDIDNEELLSTDRSPSLLENIKPIENDD